jgi:hypothetical protein
MKGTHILALTTAILWAIVLLMGFGGIDSVQSQHAPGFPSAGQMRYYIYAPALILGLTIAAWILATRWPKFKALSIALITFALIALPADLFFYTGGM